MKDGYVISTDKAKLDVSLIHDFLSNRSYWGKGRTIETVRKSIENCLCFAIYDDNAQKTGYSRASHF